MSDFILGALCATAFLTIFFGCTFWVCWNIWREAGGDLYKDGYRDGLFDGGLFVGEMGLPMDIGEKSETAWRN